MKGSVIVTSASWVGILYLVTATAVATHSDCDNVINILALTGATCVLLVHLMAAGGCFIEKSDENDLGRWPKWLHGLAHAPALLFVLFGQENTRPPCTSRRVPDEYDDSGTRARHNDDLQGQPRKLYSDTAWVQK